MTHEDVDSLERNLLPGTMLHQLCADWRRLHAELVIVTADKDELLLRLIEMKGRLGQYEAQFAHDHNLWMASRTGKMTMENERLRELLAMAEAFSQAVCDPGPRTEAQLDAFEKWQEARAALAAGKQTASGESKP